LSAPSGGIARRWRRPDGQILVFFVLFLPVLLAVIALVLEVSMIYLVRRDAQGAADLAALAGAASLPTNPTQARADASSLAAENGYAGDDVALTTPYRGSSMSLEVVITTTVRPILMPLVGIDAMPVSARAVAENSLAGLGTVAIYALHGDCRSGEPGTSIDWSGSSNVVNGDIHSRSGITVSGSGNVVGPSNSVTYECDGLHRESGDNPGILPSANPEACPGPFEETPCLRAEGPPLEHDWDTFNTSPSFRCDWSVPTGDFDLAVDGSWWHGGLKISKSLRAGKYCAPGGTIKLAESGVSVVSYQGRSGVTFVADKIDISGSDFELAPYDRDVLAFARSDQPGAIKFAGSTGSFTGLLYAPNGTVETSGSTSSTLLGGIIAGRVKLDGSSLTINGTIGTGPAREPRLVE
jgi:Putative Flp pilus-assembly TadE/G-like